jgi:hypothetical protein
MLKYLIFKHFLWYKANLQQSTLSLQSRFLLFAG